MGRILGAVRQLDKMQNAQHIRYSRYRVAQGRESENCCPAIAFAFRRAKEKTRNRIIDAGFPCLLAPQLLGMDFVSE